MRRVCDGTRPEIPDNLHPEIQDIIMRCWDVSPENRYNFTEIYEKLKSIDFMITPRVNSNQVKHFIREKTKIKVKVHLLNGEIYPMEIYPEENHIEFRRKIGLHVNLPLDLVIPSIGDRSITCCWGCNLGDNPCTFKSLIRNWTFHTKLHNNFDIDLLYQINANYYTNEKHFGPIISTKFFIKPGTISDLFNELTSQYRNLWFLKNCSFKVYFGDEELVPSDETIFEKGIPTNSTLRVIRNYNKTVTIKKKDYKCNLDDPVEELLWRFMKSRLPFFRHNKFVYLKKNGKPIDRKLTLNEAGIVDHDNLQIGYIHSDREINFVIENRKGHLFVPPNVTYSDFLSNALLAKECNHPIGTIHPIPWLPINDDDNIDSIPEISEKEYEFKKADRFYFNQYRQY